MILEVREQGVDWHLIWWPGLDDHLVGLVERYKAYETFMLQISTTADSEEVRGLLPRMAQEGILEVCFSERPDYWT